MSGAEISVKMMNRRRSGTKIFSGAYSYPLAVALNDKGKSTGMADLFGTLFKELGNDVRY